LDALKIIMPKLKEVKHCLIFFWPKNLQASSAGSV
jgi:hypothetical protein